MLVSVEYIKFIIEFSCLAEEIYRARQNNDYSPRGKGEEYLDGIQWSVKRGHPITVRNNHRRSARGGIGKGLLKIGRSKNWKKRREWSMEETGDRDDRMKGERDEDGRGNGWPRSGDVSVSDGIKRDSNAIDGFLLY